MSKQKKKLTVSDLANKRRKPIAPPQKVIKSKKKKLQNRDFDIDLRDLCA